MYVYIFSRSNIPSPGAELTWTNIFCLFCFRFWVENATPECHIYTVCICSTVHTYSIPVRCSTICSTTDNHNNALNYVFICVCVALLGSIRRERASKKLINLIRRTYDGSLNCPLCSQYKLSEYELHLHWYDNSEWRLMTVVANFLAAFVACIKN